MCQGHKVTGVKIPVCILLRPNSSFTPKVTVIYLFRNTVFADAFLRLSYNSPIEIETPVKWRSTSDPGRHDGCIVDAEVGLLRIQIVQLCELKQSPLHHNGALSQWIEGPCNE